MIKIKVETYHKHSNTPLAFFRVSANSVLERIPGTNRYMYMLASHKSNPPGMDLQSCYDDKDLVPIYSKPGVQLYKRKDPFYSEYENKTRAKGN